MDIYDLRRAVVVRLIETMFDNNQAAFSTATGISRSYVNRMLKPQSDATHKKIGTDMAVRLEAVAALELEPGTLLDPKPVERPGAQRHTAKEPPAYADTSASSEWSLPDVRDISPADKRYLEQQAAKRSAHWKTLRRDLLASVGIHGEADAASVTKALGNVPKDGKLPARSNRPEPGKSLDSRHKTSPQVGRKSRPG